MFPSLILKNQFGEQSNNFIEGGSNQMWCNFVVDKTNGNGLGIRSLKSSGANTPDIAAVYMVTSATPAATNPNPQAGIILVQFANPFAGYINGTSGSVVPLSGTPINVTSALAPGDVYIVVSVGTTTIAGWQSIGWLGNALPTVGAAFINTSATPTTGTGVVEVPLAAGDGIGQIKSVGDPNQGVISSTPTLICGVYAPTSSGSTVPVLTAPTNGSVIGLTFNMIPNPQPQI